MIGHASASEQLVSNVGGMLVAHVEKVQTLVDGALNGTLAALTELPKAIGDIGKSVKLFVPNLDLDSTLRSSVAPDTSKTGPATAEGRRITDPVAELSESLGKLRKAVTILATETSLLQGMDPMALEKVQTAVTACGGDFASVSKPLAVDRTLVAFEAGSAGAAAVSITGGTLPYSTTLLSTTMPGINVVTQPAVILITTDASIQAGGPYPVRVSDATGASTMITIRVNAKAAQKADAENPGPDGSPSARAAAPTVERGGLCEADRSPAEICLVQKVTGAAIDGRFGSSSCRTFREHAVTAGFKGNLNDQAMAAVKRSAGLDPAAGAAQIKAKLVEMGVTRCGADVLAATVPVSAAIAASAAPAAAASGATAVSAATAAACVPPPAGAACMASTGARCDFECGFNADQVGALGRKLGFNPAPQKFTTELREKLAGVQRRRGLPVTGDYDAATVRALDQP